MIANTQQYHSSKNKVLNVETGNETNHSDDLNSSVSSAREVLENQREAELASLIRGVPDLVYNFAKDAVLALARDEKLSIFEIRGLKRWQIHQGTAEIRFSSDDAMPISQESATTLTVFIGASLTHLDSNPWADEHSQFFYSDPEIAQKRVKGKFAVVDEAQALEERYSDQHTSAPVEEFDLPVKPSRAVIDSSKHRDKRTSGRVMSDSAGGSQGARLYERQESMISVPLSREPAYFANNSEPAKCIPAVSAGEYEGFLQESEVLRKEMRRLLDTVEQQGIFLGKGAGQSLTEASALLSSIEKSLLFVHEINSRTRAGLNLNFQIFARNLSRLSSCVNPEVESKYDLEVQDFNVPLIDFLKRVQAFNELTQFQKKTRSLSEAPGKQN